MKQQFKMFPTPDVMAVYPASTLSRWEWYAGQALAAVAARHDVPHNNIGGVVQAACKIADAMDAEAQRRANGGKP